MSQTKVKSGLLNFPDQTDFVKLPSGTTAQRPSSPEKGYSRYNTTDNKLEFWNGTVWQQLPGVVAPIITSISYPGDDLAADPDGGQTITINGGDFKAGATVTVDGTTPSVITFVSATEITFTAPAKTAGDYDIVVTNVDGGNATAIDGMTYNGLPSWTTPAGNLGTFPAGSTIPTITLVATEPDSGVISYSVTTGALPSGLTLSGADIDGTTPSPAGQTTYNFSVTASDDENQSTERAFNIVVYLQVTNTVSEVDPFGDSSGVALYRLENNANDEGGVYNGTWVGTPSYTTGIFGQSATFNGSSNYINIASNPLNITQDFTFSAWSKTQPSDTYNFIFASTKTTDNTIPFDACFLPNQNLIETVYNGVGYYIPFTDDGAWHHYLVTLKGTTLTTYIDGYFRDVRTVTLAPSSGDKQTIGARIRPNYQNYSQGETDQVRIFNTALTPLEVESLYIERTVLCGGQADTLDILGDNSCIATYQLNGNANDLSGNYSGTPTNVSYGVGEFDLAGVFNGSTSGINLGNGLVSSLTALSTSIWFNTNDISLNAQILLDLGFSSTGNGLQIYIGSVGNIIYRVSSGGSNVFQEVINGVISNNTWYNITATFENTTSGAYKLYLNNSLIASGNSSQTGSISFASTGLYLGHYNQTFSRFDGEIDQVRIFNKALNSTEVTTLYNETACDALACSGTTNTLDILSDGSCVAAYPLDGSPADLSGNYNGVQTDVTYPVGKFDLSGSFNGSSSNIDLGSNLGFANNSFSISFWINANDIDSDHYFIGDAAPWVAGSLHIGILSGNKIRFSFNTVGTVDSSTSISYNVWQNWVCSFDSSTKQMKIYLNGTLDNSSTSSGNYTLTGNIQLGDISISGYNYSGSLDQVRIFNKVLSAGEVTTLFNNETACN